MPNATRSTGNNDDFSQNCSRHALNYSEVSDKMTPLRSSHAFRFSKTEIDGVIFIQPEVFADHRGGGGGGRVLLPGNIQGVGFSRLAG